MKKFIYKSFLFFSIICFSIILINYFDYEKSSNYMEAIIDKHERIEKIKTPKIILAGGSNLAFGINSEKLEKEFSVPIVNMGIHAGLGLSFILEEVKFSIKEGDLVLLSIEYFMDNDGDYRLKKNTSDFYKNAKLFYSNSKYDDLKSYYNDFKSYLESTNQKFQNILSQKKYNGVYSREAFNKYGDYIGHLGKTGSKILHDKGLLNYRYWDGIETINQFNIYANKMNVKVFYLFPNYPFSEYAYNKETINQLYIDLKNNLKVEILVTNQA